MMKSSLIFFLAACCAASMTSSQRLDAALVSRGLFSSRAAAKTAIQAGRVRIDASVATKPAQLVHSVAKLHVAAGGSEFVSRAGVKLQSALETFGVELSGAAVLDVGASTGGFTDCVLQAGASEVVCVDCGHDQLAEKLRADARVTSLEGINARALTPDMLPRAAFDCVVVDVSFISLTLALPSVWPLLTSEAADARLVALVKPQFEAGKEAVAKGKGLVRDRATQERTLADVAAFASASLDDCAVVGSMESPILGGDGQREFMLVLAHASQINEDAARRGPFYVSAATKAAQANEAPETAAADPTTEVSPLEPVRMERKKTAAARKEDYRNRLQKREKRKGRSRPREEQPQREKAGPEGSPDDDLFSDF